MRSMAAARLKRARAVELASEGWTYDEIARAVGFSHRGSAHRAVSKALAEHEVAAVDDLRQLELDRLDRLQSTLWDKAMKGELSAITAILKITDQRIRILGLQAKAGEEAGVLRALVTDPIS